MATIDYAVSNIRTLFGTLRFFKNGWGPYQRRHDPWIRNLRAQNLPTVPENFSIELKPVLKTPFVHLTFDSPSASLLPPESSVAHALYIPAINCKRPHRRTSYGTIPMETASDPLVLLLAATGDHGYYRRLAFHSLFLRKRGIASVILESPFYGRRRPSGQVGAQLRFVHELSDLGRATIEESRYILTLFRRAGCRRMAVAGASQGGLHAAMVAAASPDWPVNIVAAFAPHSAAPVFTEGALSMFVDWHALGPAARPRLRDALSISDITQFPAGHPQTKGVLIFARDDQYITSESVQIWHKARPHMKMMWVRGGHVTASMLRFPIVNQAILDVLSEDISNE